MFVYWYSKYVSIIIQETKVYILYTCFSTQPGTKTKAVKTALSFVWIGTLCFIFEANFSPLLVQAPRVGIPWALRPGTRWIEENGSGDSNVGSTTKDWGVIDATVLQQFLSFVATSNHPLYCSHETYNKRLSLSSQPSLKWVEHQKHRFVGDNLHRRNSKTYKCMLQYGKYYGLTG